MKKLLLIVFTIIAANIVFAQEQIIKTKIEKVKVFQNGAQINRIAKVNVVAGKSVIIFDDIPVNINEESILVSATGDFMMLSVVHQIDSKPVGEGNAEELATINRLMKQYNDSILFENSRLEVYKSQLSLLTRLDNKFDPQDTFSLTDFKEAFDFQNIKLSDIKLNEIKSNNKIVFFNSKIQELYYRQSQLPQNTLVQKRRVIVDLSSDAPVLGSFSISYYIPNAGWSSSYDIRVKDINNPVVLHHKADVYQSTGENWDNVLISLSNGDPTESATKPILKANYIDYTAPIEILKLYGIKEDKTITGKVTDKQSGVPLPGVSVQIQGTSVSTMTDYLGKFSIRAPKGSSAILFSFIGYKNKLTPLTSQTFNIQLEYDDQKLDEVVVVGYGGQKKQQLVGACSSIPVETVDNQTTVEFDIDIPYNIPADGRKHSVMIRELSFPATYQYYCVPKINKDVFLIAKITNWESSDLSEGSANIYFEDTYLGKSQLNLLGTKDTLLLSLGRDKNIKIERTALKNNSTKQFVGNKKTDEKGYQISIKNLKKQAIDLLVEDQLPLSTFEEIVINPIELSKGEYDENSGSIKWEMHLDSQKEKTIKFKYSIKYPKGFQISEVK